MGDLPEFGEKRNTDRDFPPPFMWADNKNQTRADSAKVNTGLSTKRLQARVLP